MGAKVSRILVMKIVRYRKLDKSIIDFPLIDYPEVRFVNDGAYISRQLYWRGMQGYEYAEAKLYRYLCSCGKIKSVVEMGANVGYFTIVGASASDVKYIAVEANPGTAQYLKANVLLNSLKNVDVIVAALVGEKTDDFVELFIPIEENDDTAPTGAFVGGGESINRNSVRSVKVNTVEARSLVSDADIIKLDIEGYEFIVLNSICDYIVKNRPIIWVEVRRNTIELRNMLSRLSSDESYEIYAIAEHDLYKVSSDVIKTIVLQEKYNTRDVIIVPSEKSTIICAYRAEF